MKLFFLIVTTLSGGVLFVGTPAYAQKLGKCSFDTRNLDFAGSPIEQARCLLSPVARKGRIGPSVAEIGQVLEQRIGKALTIDKVALKQMLISENLEGLSTNLDRPVSTTSEGISARYFVIHDTSQKSSGTKFPPNDDVRLNQLGFKYPDKTWVAHVFVNRLGKVLAAHDFEKPWRATQLEKAAGGRSRGLFLHVEHNQPRLEAKDGKPGNDHDAPTPGFTSNQYDRSAILYITASARAGKWLIPAFHAVMDKGVGSHDDPQNFDRTAWEQALERRLQGLETTTSSIADGSKITPLRASLYYMALEGDYTAGNDATFRTRDGVLLHTGSRQFFDKASIEGSAKLADGRVINVDGKVGVETRWRVISQAYGLDAVGCGLVPFRSAAVDRNVVPLRTKIFLEKTVGMPLPDGTQHDGLWYAVDVGSAIKGDRVDLFLGAGRATMDVPRAHGIGHLEALKAETRGKLTGCTPT